MNYKHLGPWIAKHVMGWTRLCDAGLATAHWVTGRHIRGEGTPIQFCDSYTPHKDSAQAFDVLLACDKREVQGTQFVCLAFSPPGVSRMSAKRGHWTVGRIKDGHWEGPLGQAIELQAVICLHARQLFDNNEQK